MSEWVPVIAALAGTLIGSLISYLSTVATIRRDEKSESRAIIIGARREVASIKLEYLSSMTKWLDEGLEIQKSVVPIQTFLTDDIGYINDPKPNISEIVNGLVSWSTSSERLIILAQIYDPLVDPKAPKWDDQFIENLPEDLPRLLGAFNSIMHSFVWTLLRDYQHIEIDAPMPPDENEFIPLPNAEKYIIPIYQKSQLALERIREFVVTEPLAPKINWK